MQQLRLQIPKVQFQRIKRSLNNKASASAKLAKELAEHNLVEIQVTVRNRRILTLVFLEEESSQPLLVEEVMVTETLIIEEEDN